MAKDLYMLPSFLLIDSSYFKIGNDQISGWHLLFSKTTYPLGGSIGRVILVFCHPENVLETFFQGEVGFLP